MTNTKQILLALLFALIAYFISVLFHEWSHGLVAWLYSIKSSPFDIHYGGLLLLHADEQVPYDLLLSHNHLSEVAWIGIAGVTYNFLMLMLGYYYLRQKKLMRKYPIWNSWFYWLSALNLCPILGYIPNGTFSKGGDIGRFVEGTNASPWLIFIIGTTIVAYWVYLLIWQYFPDLISNLKVSNIWIQRLYLWLTIFTLFFLIYTHGYNPFSDSGASFLSKCIAAVSLVVACILLYILNPSNSKIHDLNKYHQ
jgi:hypothetical protein